MITKPPIDKLTKLAGNRYILCCAVSKRAKTLNLMQINDEIAATIKTISHAADEVSNGEVEIVKGE